MEKAWEPLLIAVECMVFMGAIVALMTVSRKYTSIESHVDKEVTQKIDVHTTYTDMEHEEDTYMAGASVISEIMTYDRGIQVKINSTVVNNIKTPTGQNIYDYIQEYGTEILLKEVSITGTYKKICVLNNNGELSQIQYLLV